MRIIKQWAASLLVAATLGSCSNQKVENTSKEKPKPNPVDLVYNQLDTENSRWFFFSSACRPFGMVNLNPDTEVDGAWGSGYRYITDTIRGFSHIHAWQMAGLTVMPISKEKGATFSYTKYHSSFSHDKEVVAPGYHKVELDRYNSTVELTSTKRVGFHKYQFDNTKENQLVIDLEGILGPCEITKGEVVQETETSFYGSFVMQPTIRRPKPFKAYFKIEMNTPVTHFAKDNLSNNYVLTLSNSANPVLMKVALSYTSVENASNNLKQELNHWNFDQVVADSKEEWNQMLSRIQVTGNTQQAQRRFYTDLWHALQGRRIISDANGAYPDNTGNSFRIGHLPLDDTGKPLFNHYNSDSFWGAQWTLNTLWGLVYPEIMHEFSQSLMQYYKDGGLVPRGPSGGNYTYVMTGASSTPFLVSAIQKGIVKDSLEFIYEALKKNHTLVGLMAKAGYEHTTHLGGGFKHYLTKGYAPFPLPTEEQGHGIHLDGTGQTLEYSYQDWTLAQLAKKLGKDEDVELFQNRAKNYKNVYHKGFGWMVPKTASGDWKLDFDPYQYENGFVESNSAQATWFVPHDLEGLASLMGGKEAAVAKLENQFKDAEKLKFTSGNSHDKELHPEYSRIPVNFGNQPSIQTAFVFHLLGRPDLTQLWSRKVVEQAFSGLSPATGYCGDEDQGLMGSLNVLLKIGLFQMNGGTEANPVYQIGSPIFDEVKISLNPDYYPGNVLTIKANGAAAGNYYVNSATFNGSNLANFAIDHNRLVAGGELDLQMTKTFDPMP
ncbi:alpha-mannosidase [Croceivirga radicis]|uniref:Alpha-mannosidase n=1 Tax=Croceivirga radicis TaxID=1929488 RepID=A0A1V6LSI7_9FLAO|nr:GH92 family glycosyl hydrolase [Croceivirga radicis]OQD43144.1 alpha-mannosidase [Croceivirga radicis]